MRAVVAYAERLRTRAQELMLKDPYVRPYYPTTAAARKLSSRLGPRGALEHMARRALQTDREAIEAEAEAERARKRHSRAAAEAVHDREASREQLTLGQRMDAALAALSVIAVPAAGAIGTSPHGAGGEQPVPRYPGDPSARARAKALEAVRFCEHELDNARLSSSSLDTPIP